MGDVESKGKDLFVTRENAVNLKKNEIFIGIWSDFVVIADRDVCRHVTGCFQTAANDVFVLTVRRNEVLVPIH